MVGILCLSIVAAISMGLLVRLIDGKDEPDDDPDPVLDGAARRERRGQRALAGYVKGWWWH